MADGGYIGKMLFVDLSVASVREEPLDRSLTRQFVGGHGLGTRILYSLQRAGVDALGPENTLGLSPDPLPERLSPAALGIRLLPSPH